MERFRQPEEDYGLEGDRSGGDYNGRPFKRIYTPLNQRKKYKKQQQKALYSRQLGDEISGGMDQTIVMKGNIMSYVNSKKIDELAKGVYHRKPEDAVLVSQSPERTIILDLKNSILQISFYIRGVLKNLFIRLGLAEDKPDPVLEEFKQFAKLYEMYCTEEAEVMAYYSAFGKAYYELQEMTKAGYSENEIRRIYKEFIDTFTW